MIIIFVKTQTTVGTIASYTVVGNFMVSQRQLLNLWTNIMQG